MTQPLLSLVFSLGASGVTLKPLPMALLNQYIAIKAGSPVTK